MQIFHVEFPCEAVFDDQRDGTIYRFDAGSRASLPDYLVIPLLLESDPPIRLLSPVQLRCGFQVRWCDSDGRMEEGRLLMQLNRLLDDRVEEWLLVDQSGNGVLIPRTQLVGCDPAPMIAAVRQAYHTSKSDGLPLLAEAVMKEVLKLEKH